MNPISICTYSRNRTYQVKKFVPKALESMSESDELVFVDYGDPQNSKDYVLSINDPRIKVVEVPGVKHWHMNHARNCSAVYAEKDILLFCDIDVYIEKESLDFIRKNVTDENFVAGNNSALSHGSCAIKRIMYDTVNGYEEMFTGWGFDDHCMYRMLASNGFKLKRLPKCESDNNIEGSRFNYREHHDSTNTEFNQGLMNYISSKKIKRANFQRTIGYGARLISRLNQEPREIKERVCEYSTQNNPKRLLVSSNENVREYQTRRFESHINNIKTKFYPIIDAIRTEGELIIQYYVPGLLLEDVKIEVYFDRKNNSFLRISGKMNSDYTYEGEYHIREFYCRHAGVIQTFSNTLRLPVDVVKKDPEINLSNGILKLVFETFKDMNRSYFV